MMKGLKPGMAALTMLLLSALLLVSCGTEPQQAADMVAEEKGGLPDSARIVSLSGTLTEIICAAGLTEKLVGVDVTSTYPEAIQALPRTGHSRNLNPEGILSLQPTHIFAKKDELKEELLTQLTQAGVKVYTFDQTYTAEGTYSLISALCDTLGRPEAAAGIIGKIKADLDQVEALPQAPKVLFIYARGAGNLMVAGEGTSMEKLIDMAGGKNAVSGFTDFKPLNTEALAAGDPDVVLMFSSGRNSIESEGGMMAIPGMKQTRAGKLGQFLSFDGQLLSGFGPRLGEAVVTLNKELAKLTPRD